MYTQRMDKEAITAKLTKVAQDRHHHVDQVTPGMAVSLSVGAGSLRLVVTSVISIEFGSRGLDLPKGLSFVEIIKAAEVFMYENCRV